jgi:hypothetical protein
VTQLAGVSSGQTVQVLGLKQLRATMRKAGVDMTQFKEPNQHAADIVAPVAKGRAPIGTTDKKPQHLYMTVRASATQTAGIIRAGNNTTVPYANPIHWGWVRRNIRPNPFVSVAAQQTEPIWTEVYWAWLQKIIQQIEGET